MASTALYRKSEFTQLIDDTLIHTIDDDLVINVGTIKALIPLISKGVLEKEQLQTILTVLDDATVENRLALHDLLSRANFSDSSSVMHCLKKMLQSLKRFPMDKFSIFSCLGGIGKKHAPMVLAHVTELLDLHPIFDTPEQNIDDDIYVAKLILVLNAASKHSIICSFIPKYVRNHYRYLLRTWPKLIPIISEFEETKHILIQFPTFSESGDGEDKIWSSSEMVPSGMNTVKAIRVLEPTREFQNTEIVRFVAGLPTGIFMRALLENVTDEELRRLRFQIEYPDQTVDYQRPMRTDFLRLNGHSVHLQTHVLVSAQRWAMPASITFVAGICTKGFLHVNVKGGKDAQQNFEPLKDAENMSKNNRITVNIHPVSQA